MGTLSTGILGAVKGKVGPVIGSDWKGINVVRKYFVPANPNTSSQQAQRSKFALAVALCRSILSTVINVFIDPFATSKSGFNVLMTRLLLGMDSNNKLQATTPITQGTLMGLPSIVATYNTSNGEFEVSFANNSGSGNALSTDNFNVLVYDKSANKFLAFFAGMGTRAELGGVENVSAGLTATNIILYVWMSRGSGVDFLVSDSVGDVCAAA